MSKSDISSEALSTWVSQVQGSRRYSLGREHSMDETIKALSAF